MDTIIGIDLGTTNSCLGSYRRNRVELVEDENGAYLIPSVVCFCDEEVVVGKAAKEVAHKHISQTVYDVKRFIGLPYASITKDADRVLYEVINVKGYPNVRINDKDLLPEEISSYVLKEIRRLANTRLETNIKRAVITVPAYFGASQRDATKDAANLAGIEEVYLINEPTAAALAFQHDNGKEHERNLLIYDFGGGTFDVSIVKAIGKYCEVKAIGGDCHLGGIDVTMKLFEYIKNDMEQNCGTSFETETFLVNKKRIQNSCEEIKEMLSRNSKYSWDFYYKSGEYRANISRTLLENLAEDIFQKTLRIVENCISDAKLRKDDIDIVVLVGGSTRIPRVRTILAEYFGEDKINISRNPDQLVAYGAVIYAESLLGHNYVMSFEDVLSQSLGTDIEGDKFDKIIPRNTRIPIKQSRKYTTITDYQKQMTVTIYQGESATASENTLLGQFVISKLTEAPARTTVVEISFCLNKEGILKVQAMENNTNNHKELEVSINSKSGKKCFQAYSESRDDGTNTSGDKKPNVQSTINQIKERKKFVLKDRKLLETKIEFQKLYSYLATTEEILEENKTAFLRKIFKHRAEIESFDESRVADIEAINKEITKFIEKNKL